MSLKNQHNQIVLRPAEPSDLEKAGEWVESFILPERLTEGEEGKLFSADHHLRRSFLRSETFIGLMNDEPCCLVILMPLELVTKLPKKITAGPGDFHIRVFFVKGFPEGSSLEKLWRAVTAYFATRPLYRRLVTDLPPGDQSEAAILKAGFLPAGSVLTSFRQDYYLWERPATPYV